MEQLYVTSQALEKFKTKPPQPVAQTLAPSYSVPVIQPIKKATEEELETLFISNNNSSVRLQTPKFSKRASGSITPLTPHKKEKV